MEYILTFWHEKYSMDLHLVKISKKDFKSTKLHRPPLALGEGETREQ